MIGVLIVLLCLIAIGLLTDIGASIWGDGSQHRIDRLEALPAPRRRLGEPVGPRERFCWARPDWTDRARLARLYAWPAAIEGRVGGGSEIQPWSA